MTIAKFLPSVALAPFIREFIFIETSLKTLSTVIPDTSIAMAFRYKGDILKLEGVDSSHIPSIVISGLRRSPRHFCYTNDTANLVVIFKEGGMAAFSGMPANEIYGLSVSADEVFASDDLQALIDRLSDAIANSDRVRLIESFFLDRLTRAVSDRLIGTAVDLIRQHSGNIRIKDLATSLYISQDAFEKRFRSLVGSSPKQYASIIRLRHLIRKYPSYSSLTDASYEAGYFDQSHFIKDFRLFTGQTPKDFFQSPQSW